jgi:hypothetical protein
MGAQDNTTPRIPCSASRNPLSHPFTPEIRSDRVPPQRGPGFELDAPRNGGNMSDKTAKSEDKKNPEEKELKESELEQAAGGAVEAESPEYYKIHLDAETKTP